MLGEDKVARDYQRRAADNAEIPSELLIFNRLLALLDKDKIIEIEVDTEEHHKHRYDHLGIEAVIALDAVVEHCEAACARRRKGVDYAVKQRHSAEGEHDYLNESHHAIDAVKYPCRDAEL